MIVFLFILLVISPLHPIEFGVDVNSYQQNYLNNQNSDIINKSTTINKSKYGNEILDNFIDEDSYIVGPGDIFLFNMVTSNDVINLELTVSPSGHILIPIVGVIDIRNKTLND